MRDKTTIIFTIIVIFIILIAFILCFNKLAETYYEVSADQCKELNGTLVQYSGCHFGTCKHDGGVFCLLDNGTEIALQINASG